MAKVNPIQLQKHLKGVDYPASKEQLIQHAQKQGADDNAISVLQQIPDQDVRRGNGLCLMVSLPDYWKF
ncbi:DUF2795 domain-containing protein [Scytonema sp. PCC 10023]|uniref:DUF2795 domain-containing protein n=1 Tax=Scytonema sp. PCC 10023 TaxID=1680591 RepID=UPI0039C75FB8